MISKNKYVNSGVYNWKMILSDLKLSQYRKAMVIVT